MTLHNQSRGDQILLTMHCISESSIHVKSLSLSVRLSVTSLFKLTASSLRRRNSSHRALRIVPRIELEHLVKAPLTNSRHKKMSTRRRAGVRESTHRRGSTRFHISLFSRACLTLRRFLFYGAVACSVLNILAIYGT